MRNLEVVDQACLRAKYGVASGPAYADLAALRGDPSDGLPGVAGVGEKTAAALINRYGDLATLRRALADGDPLLKGARRARLEAAADYLDVAPRSSGWRRDAPVGEHDPALPTSVADPVLLSGLAADYGLASSFNRVLRRRSVWATDPRRRRRSGAGDGGQSSRVRGDDAAPDGVDRLAGGGGQRRLGAASRDLAEQVDDLLAPRTKSPAARSLSLSTDVEPLRRWPSGAAPRPCRRPARVVTCSPWACSRSSSALHSRTVSCSASGRRRPASAGEVSPSSRRGSWTSVDTAAASPAASRPAHTPCAQALGGEQVALGVEPAQRLPGGVTSVPSAAGSPARRAGRRPGRRSGPPSWCGPATLRVRCRRSRGCSRHQRSAQRAWSSRSGQPWHGCARSCRRSSASSLVLAAGVGPRPRRLGGGSCGTLDPQRSRPGRGGTAGCAR